jgi:hypothetical protein
MIPETLNSDNLIDIDEFESPPSLTYRLDFTNRRIIGKVDDKEAVMQFIKKVLDTSKYSYEIYDWYYGNELLELVGMSYDYISVEAPRIVEEALLVDDRITYIDSWSFTRLSVDSMEISFLVHTIYGDIKYTEEVAS